MKSMIGFYGCRKGMTTKIIDEKDHHMENKNAIKYQNPFACNGLIFQMKIFIYQLHVG